MEYLTTSETAERWGITARRVQVLCKEGRVEGAVYKGVWLIPADAKKPEDPRRSKKHNTIDEVLANYDEMQTAMREFLECVANAEPKEK